MSHCTRRRRAHPRQQRHWQSILSFARGLSSWISRSLLTAPDHVGQHPITNSFSVWQQSDQPRTNPARAPSHARRANATKRKWSAAGKELTIRRATRRVLFTQAAQRVRPRSPSLTESPSSSRCTLVCETSARCRAPMPVNGESCYLGIERWRRRRTQHRSPRRPWTRSSSCCRVEGPSSSCSSLRRAAVRLDSSGR